MNVRRFSGAVIALTLLCLPAACSSGSSSTKADRDKFCPPFKTYMATPSVISNFKQSADSPPPDRLNEDTAKMFNAVKKYVPSQQKDQIKMLTAYSKKAEAADYDPVKADTLGTNTAESAAFRQNGMLVLGYLSTECKIAIPGK